MIDPELERKFKEMRAKKKELLRKFTRKAVDAVNASEEVSQTFLSICDTDCAVEVKSTKKLSKKKAPKREPEADAS